MCKQTIAPAYWSVEEGVFLFMTVTCMWGGGGWESALLYTRAVVLQTSHWSCD